MDGADIRLRNELYSRFVQTGRTPRADPAALRRLHDAHALVLEGDEIRMLNPFSLVPTPHRVQAGGRWWYANCAWDALGIVAALGADGHLSSSCPDCAEPIELGVRDGRLDGDGHVFHVLIPARRWWDDIVFT